MVRQKAKSVASENSVPEPVNTGFVVQEIEILPPTKGGGGRRKEDNPMTEYVLRSWDSQKPLQFSGVPESDVKKIVLQLVRAADALGLGLDKRVSGDVISFKARKKIERKRRV